MDEIKERVLRSGEITEFQRRVYLELLKVPRGETVSYGELARRVGCRSAQAVGQALHRNPFAPDVPCHRVIAADGSLGGYALGLERKAELLKEEGGRVCVADGSAEGRNSDVFFIKSPPH